MKKPFTTEKFIEKARAIHGERYDYKQAKYQHNKIKITVTCKQHGDFNLTPNHHLSGIGCPKCGNKNLFISDDTETFIQKAKKVHGNRYDYSKAKYINNLTKLVIVCKQHGEFLQKPESHKQGRGCLRCVNRSEGKKTMSTEEFVKRANNKHNCKYDYHRTQYINQYTKIIVTCKQHGDFKQWPNNHLRGYGCFQCSRTLKSSKPETEFLDYLNVPKENRQYPIDRYFVDGVVNNTIYEFLGDYWHGHNRMEKGLNHIDIQIKRMLTQVRFEQLQKLTGCNIKYVWEADWNEFKKLGGQLKLRTFKDRLTID